MGIFDSLMQMKSTPFSSNRLVLVVFVTFAVFTTLIFYAFKLQIIEYGQWKRVADRQHMANLNMPAKRGSFYCVPMERPGVKPSPIIVALDEAVYHLIADPFLLEGKNKKAIVRWLAERFDWNEKEQVKAEDSFSKPVRARKILSNLLQQQKDLLMEEWREIAKKEGFPIHAIYFSKDFRRAHPLGRSLGQLLHTIRADKDPKTGQPIPTGGLELKFHNDLCGTPGKGFIYRTPRHQLDDRVIESSPQNGKDIFLTIDPFIQAICEEEIAEGVTRCRASSGFAIVMEAETGRIRAIAHYPFFRVDEYPDYFNDAAKIEYTIPKAVSALFEPGSIIKPVTVALAMMAGDERALKGLPPLFREDEIITTSPTVFPGRTKPVTDVCHLSKMDLALALQKSSNVYTATLAERIIQTMGVDWYRDKLTSIFDLGKPTGIEFPGEAVGFLPTPGKCHPNGGLEWSRATPYSLAMGYNLMVTGLQMAKIYAMITNGGYQVDPTLIYGPLKPKRASLSPVICDKLKHYLRFVTKPGGSAQLADVYGYTELGKTSTSEKLLGGVYSSIHHNTLFVGVCPLSCRPLVIVIALDDPDPSLWPSLGKRHYGGKSAAPIFRRIAQRSVAFLGIPPDDPGGYPKGDPRYNPETADAVKEVEALHEKMLKLNRR